MYSSPFIWTGPSQRSMRSGDVTASHTSAGVAAYSCRNVTVRSGPSANRVPQSSVIFVLLGLLGTPASGQLGLQGVQALGPERPDLRDPVGQVVEGLAVDRVD